MESTFRDLDRIEELGEGPESNRALVFGLATFMAAATIFAVGLAIGHQRGSAQSTPSIADPLSSLSQRSQLPKILSNKAHAEEPEVQRESLSYAEVLANGREGSNDIRDSVGGKPSLEPEKTPLAAPIAPTRALYPATTPRLAQGAQHISLYVASYPAPRQAQRMVLALRNKGYLAYQSQRFSPQHQTVVWQVLIGPMVSEQEASALQKRLQSQELIQTSLISSAM